MLSGPECILWNINAYIEYQWGVHTKFDLILMSAFIQKIKP